MDITRAIEAVGAVIEVFGVAVIVIGMVMATTVFLRRIARGRQFDEIYRLYRQSVGRAILLGLEFLVAGDIIRIVAVEPTFGTVGVLAGIVLIRTFLSFSLEVELENRWPWQSRRSSTPDDAESTRK